MQRYTHPTQIPRSKTIKSIDWQSELIRIKNPDITGDSHPMTWAADDAIYIGNKGDSNDLKEIIRASKSMWGYFDKSSIFFKQYFEYS